MRFVIAAYAVVIGVIGLYGLYLMLERRRLIRALVTRTAEPIPTRRYFGFNVGAFLLPAIWLIGHGRIGFGLGLLSLNLVAVTNGYRRPGTGLIVSFGVLAVGLALGITGNRISCNHFGLSTRDELRTRETPWLYLGLIVTYIQYVYLALMFFPA